MDSEDKKYNVPGLDRALSIIELLNANPLGLSVNLIANRLNYPLNSVYRIMTTLERRKYVSKQSGESVFVLSEKLLKLATPVAGEPAFIEMALPKMRSLRDSSQETVLAGVLVGEEGVVLEQVEGLHSFSFRVNPGLRFPLHTAAPGKIFLSQLEPKQRTSMIGKLKLAKFTSKTIISKEGLEEEIQKVLDLGYAIDYEEEIKGQACIGAPVFGRNAKLAGSIWLVAPTSRLPKKKVPDVASMVMKSADEISLALGNQFLRVA